MTRSNLILTLVGSILLPLAITSLSVASNYGELGGSLKEIQSSQEQILTAQKTLNDEITGLKIASATSGEKVANIEANVNQIKSDLINKDQFNTVAVKVADIEQRMVSKEAVEMVSANIADMRVNASVKIGQLESNVGVLNSDLTKVETIIEERTKDLFTGADGRALAERVDKLEGKESR